MKKILSLILAAACCFALLTACGSNNNATPSASAPSSNGEETSATDGIDPNVDYDALAGTTIKVAASPTPHAEILAVAKDILAQKDITLEMCIRDRYGGSRYETMYGRRKSASQTEKDYWPGAGN